MATLEELKNCKSYADVIKLVFEKNYTNKSIIKKIKEWCLSNYNFDLEKHIQDYKTRKVYCLNCGEEIKGKDRFKRKFCCQSCVVSYNNKQRESITKEQKKKISETLLRNWYYDKRN